MADRYGSAPVGSLFRASGCLCIGSFRADGDIAGKRWFVFLER
ncbi:hypothetical protein [Alitiscatomonas aceti]|uniref:Uncharacterized protein n=1 Tax=Alitiscatomonas aceti TaxID=2981724 RepID=A0ABT2UZ33_9FIRM|nr:hypothetical protein [Alitiscatomonas aceti]MCU6799416.1 hypothetical protein [Alitiscatomonas aceti]